MRKLINGVLIITVLMMLFSVSSTASTLPDGFEVVDVNFFINDELQQITVYRNNNSCQPEKNDYVPLQACIEKIGCTFERKNETDITIETPDNRIIDIYLYKNTINYSHHVSWEYFEVDGVIYSPIFEFTLLIDCKAVYDGESFYLDTGEYLEKINADSNIGRKVNIDVYVNDIKIETLVYKDGKAPSIPGPHNWFDYVQLKPIEETLGIDMSSSDELYNSAHKQVSFNGEIYIRFSTIRSYIDGSLKQDDYDSIYLYSADYVRQDIPATLEEAYKALDERLDPEDIEYIKNLSEWHVIIELRSELGMWMDDNWLNPTNSRLTKALLELAPNFSDTYDMSNFILVGYHAYLNSDSAPILTENSDITFSDLPEEHWAYKDIISLTKSGVLDGYEDGTFQPDNNVTHAEMAKIITIAFDLHGNNGGDSETTSYTIKEDIKNGSPDKWWSEFALIAVDYYYPGGLSIVYKSDDEVDRRQVAVALVNILNPEYTFDYTTAGYSLPSDWKKTLENEFSDLFAGDNDGYIDVSDGYFAGSPKHIYLAKAMGLISGYSDGTFRSYDNITRAEFCAMLNRALALYE